MSTSSASAANPLVTIIVPSYDQGRFIRRTLASILAQDYRPLQVVVVDGGSTDETVAILREHDAMPEVEWLSERDSGVVEAVNKGLARARGSIGAIQSSDDFYLPGAVRAAVDALAADESLAFVYGDIAKVDADGNEIERTSLAPYSLEAVFSLETWIPQPSTFFRMDLARALGGWRESVPYAADTDLWLRMALRAPATKLDRVMAERTMHEAQRDRQGERIVRDYCRMIDTLDGLAAAPSRIRRAAAAGKLLLMNRYGNASPLRRVVRLWRAAFAYPSLFARFPLASFVPGWYRARSAMAGLARMARER